MSDSSFNKGGIVGADQALADVREAWSGIQAKLRSEFGDSTFRSWLKPLEVVDFDTYRLRLSVPSRFVRDWVQANYAPKILSLWQEELEALRAIEIIVRASERASQLKPTAPQANTSSSLPPLSSGLREPVLAGDAARAPARTAARRQG